MPNFWFAVACNKPRLCDRAQVLQIIARYWFDFDCEVAIKQDSDGQACLAIDGDGWPAAWLLPPDTSAEEYYPDYPTLGQEEFAAFLIEIAPFLMEHLIVQAIGTVNGRFPLSACEWRVAPGSNTVAKFEFTTPSESTAPLSLASA